VFVPWRGLYNCNQPAATRRDRSRLLFHNAFLDLYTISVDYEIELRGLDSGSVAVKQKLGVESASRIDGDVKLVLPRNIQLPDQQRCSYLSKTASGGVSPLPSSSLWRCRSKKCTVESGTPRTEDSVWACDLPTAYRRAPAFRSLSNPLRC